MGIAGTHLLIDRLEGRPIQDARLTLPTSLVVRASTDVPAGP
jgi:DNA-binding LacI/PurR family transcriptional regulator